jgi:hypothetical protein
MMLHQIEVSASGSGYSSIYMVAMCSAAFSVRPSKAIPVRATVPASLSRQEAWKVIPYAPAALAAAVGQEGESGRWQLKKLRREGGPWHGQAFPFEDYAFDIS